MNYNFQRVAAAISAFVIPSMVYAATLDTPQGVLGTIIKIAGFLGQLLMTLSIVVVLWAGFRYMTAGDSEDKVTDATKTLTYAVVGIIVGLLSFSIPGIVQEFIN